MSDYDQYAQYIRVGDKLVKWDEVPLAARLMYFLRRALSWPRRALIASRLTPALRERCVEYAVRSGATGWGVQKEAERLAEWIARGKEP